MDFLMMDISSDENDVESSELSKLLYSMNMAATNIDLYPNLAPIVEIINYMDAHQDIDIDFGDEDVEGLEYYDALENLIPEPLQGDGDGDRHDNYNNKDQDGEFILEGPPSCVELQAVVDRTLQQNESPIPYLPHYDELKATIADLTEKAYSEDAFSQEESRLFSETIEAAYLRIVLRKEILRIDANLQRSRETINEPPQVPVSAMFRLPEPVNVGPEGPEEYVATPRQELASMIDSRIMAHEMLAIQDDERTRAVAAAAAAAATAAANNLRRSNDVQVDEMSSSDVKRFKRGDGTC